MSFTAADVKALREKTGLGMMDCKKALTEHNGDAAAAEEWLREQRKGKMDERTERVPLVKDASPSAPVTTVPP